MVDGGEPLVKGPERITTDDARDRFEAVLVTAQRGHLCDDAKHLLTELEGDYPLTVREVELSSVEGLALSRGENSSGSWIRDRGGEADMGGLYLGGSLIAAFLAGSVALFGYRGTPRLRECLTRGYQKPLQDTSGHELHWSHNPKVAGSNPAPATNENPCIQGFSPGAPRTSGARPWEPLGLELISCGHAQHFDGDVCGAGGGEPGPVGQRSPLSGTSHPLYVDVIQRGHPVVATGHLPIQHPQFGRRTHIRSVRMGWIRWARLPPSGNVNA